MDDSWVWKSVSLSRELSVSGSFLYNGLKIFHEIEILDYEEEIFEFLYNIAVGIERLAKIAVVLIEHHDVNDQNKFEKSLITHTPSALIERVKKAHTINLKSSHNSFTNLLGDFYNNCRYSRFRLNELRERVTEESLFKKYLTEQLNFVFEHDTGSIFNNLNNNKIRVSVGKVVGHIADQLFNIVWQEARQQNMYTYELRHNSKAYKIFMRKEYDFLKEEALAKEVMIALLNNRENTGVIGLMRNVEPITLDCSTKYQLQCLLNDKIKLEHLDDLDAFYENVEDINKRKEMLDVVGNPYCYFPDEEEFDDDVVSIE